MNIHKISIKNYKAFLEKQSIEIKPITVLIGKNSSGKSAITKLFTLFENSLSGKIKSPILLENNGVELGVDFRDLVFNKTFSLGIEFEISFEDNSELSVTINEYEYEKIILKWKYKKGETDYNFIYNRNKKLYEDTQGCFFNINFNGFIPEKIINISTKESINIDFSNLAISIDYIGPFRKFPSRTFSISGNIVDKIGVEGENAYNLIGQSKLKKTDLIKNVGKWYSKYFDNWELDVYVNNFPILETVLIKNTKPKDFRINIKDVGEGMSQVLPLIVNAFQEKNMLTVIEQPELHLHPEAHANLAELFAMSAIENKKKYIIETHSENFILRLRRLIVDANSPLKSEDVVIYWIEEGENGHTIEPITINKKGILSDWPEGVFNENIEEIAAIKKAAKIMKHDN